MDYFLKYIKKHSKFILQSDSYLIKYIPYLNIFHKYNS